MTESGKIDWACHANDAAASIHDVLEMSNAVQAAVDFYNAHPNETLILVTADHETGGLAIGYKTTNYDTFLTNLTHQKMSYAKFDTDYVQNYIANKTPFETAMQDVKAAFGLTLPTDPDAANAGKLQLTDYEVQNLRTAYDRTLEVGSASQKDMTQQDYELYGTYIPSAWPSATPSTTSPAWTTPPMPTPVPWSTCTPWASVPRSSAACTTTPRSSTSWLS